MLIENPVYKPFILTIPDDGIVFSLFDENNVYTEKFFMENYINFYSINPPPLERVVFRFENFMDYESIHGIERYFIPVGMMKKYASDPVVIWKLLEEGYIINMPVDRGSISFYGKNAGGTHHMLIFGAESEEGVFLCKDFKGHDFVEFKTTFSEWKESIQKYNNPTSREADGLLALRIDRTVSPNIEYSKVLSEFNKLRTDIYNEYSGYGIGALSLFIRDVEEKEWDSVLCYRWYETSNFMREASKLMQFRYGTVSKIFGEGEANNMIELKNSVNKLKQDTDRLFLKVCKFSLKKSEPGISNRLAALARICRDDFKRTSDLFYRVIEAQTVYGNLSHHGFP